MHRSTVKKRGAGHTVPLGGSHRLRSLSLAVRGTSEGKLVSRNFQVIQVQKRKWALIKYLSRQDNKTYHCRGRKQAENSEGVLQIWD